MLERNLAFELDELLKQNAQEKFSYSLSKRFSDKYKVLGVQLDMLIILPGMLQEDLVLFSLERSKSILFEMCVSDYFEKALIGYKTLSGMHLLLANLSADEMWSVRPFENEYLIHVYFTHLIPVFLRENKERYRLMNILLSSKNDMVLDLAHKAIQLARIQFPKPVDRTDSIKNNPINSKYFVA